MGSRNGNLDAGGKTVARDGDLVAKSNGQSCRGGATDAISNRHVSEECPKKAQITLAQNDEARIRPFDEGDVDTLKGTIHPTSESRTDGSRL